MKFRHAKIVLVCGFYIGLNWSFLVVRTQEGFEYNCNKFSKHLSYKVKENQGRPINKFFLWSLPPKFHFIVFCFKEKACISFLYHKENIVTVTILIL